jgi:hypothetical protein
LSKVGRRRALGLVVVVAALVTSCSSGNSGGKSNDSASTTWDPAAMAQLKTVTARISTRIPKQCVKVESVDAKAEREGIRKIGGKVEPAAMVGCNILGEDEELAAFGDPNTRDRWIDERARLFCKTSERHQIGFPGLHWVTGGSWSILTDTEGVGRRVALATSSTYRGTPCSGQQLDWNPGAVAEAQALADKIAAARLGCADFMVKDLDTERHDPLYGKPGLPATLGSCTLRRTSDNQLVIAVTRPASVSLQKLVDTLSSAACPTTPAAAIVVGRDWAVATERDIVARRIAPVTGGRVQLCPQ